MGTDATPISSVERLFSLDVVRGVALLGIFIMNIPAFSTSFSGGAEQWPDWWDRTAETLRDVLFSGKFNSMFSMLFAIGFTIQLERLLARDPRNGMWTYVRRICWLLVFGLLHACIFWTGDVLHVYALLGFVLLAIRKLPDRFVVAMIVVCLLYVPVAGLLRMHYMTADQIAQAVATNRAWEAADNAAYGTGTFVQAMAQNVRALISLYTDRAFLYSTSLFYVQIVTTMLIGLVLGRHAIFQRAQSFLPQIRKVQWSALAFGILTGMVLGWWKATVQNPTEPTVFKLIASTCYTLCRISLMAFYVTTLMRGVYSERWRARLQPFAIAGRMPLTNYLLQTLLATFFFDGWGLGFWGKVGPALGVLLAVGVYALIQLPLSRWWLARFEFGPMEYAWRVLTYGRTGLTQSATQKAAAV